MGGGVGGAPSSWAWGECCPQCASASVRVARRGAQAYFSCTSCGNQWLQHIAPETHGHRALIALLVGILVVALVAGGGAAYGVLAKGNALALLPWGQRSSGHSTNNSTGSAGESRTATSAPTASVLSLPIPPKPTTMLPQPGARPIIFIPGIMGSYLGDTSGETWPQIQTLTSCGLVSPSYSCQESVARARRSDRRWNTRGRRHGRLWRRPARPGRRPVHHLRPVVPAATQLPLLVPRTRTGTTSSPKTPRRVVTASSSPQIPPV